MLAHKLTTYKKILEKQEKGKPFMDLKGERNQNKIESN